MDETAQKLLEIRSSLGSFSNFSQANELETEIDDPISAYFRQRCGDSSKTYFKKHVDSDSDSSVGLIDVDNVSLFGDGGENEINTLRLSENLLEKFRDSFNVKSNKRQVDGDKCAGDSQLDKQRALAQKALQKINVKTSKSENEEPVKTPEKIRESKALSDISSKIINSKLSSGKNVDSWFQPNYSPNTPRLFNDELSSYIDNEDVPVKDENVNKKRESEYAKKVSSILKEFSVVNLNADAEFESQTKEEQIHRFEEDEKKFKLEHSGLLHNSEISQFSGLGGGESSQWPMNSSTAKVEGENNKLSIGQFFNMRSNRVSSLLGSKTDEKKSQTSDSFEIKDQKSPKSNGSFTTCNDLLPEKLKPRRYGSSYELNRNIESRKSTRYSSDSCSSNSTIMIQNIISEMESGLSGTQIYEKLLKSYKKTEDKDKQKNKKPTVPVIQIQNSETPKSSKVQKRKEIVADLKKQQEPVKQPKNRFSTKEFKENEPVCDAELNESFPCTKTKKGRLNHGRSFEASTPKLCFSKAQNNRFKNSCKIVMDAEDWEAPRVSSIHPIVDLNRSEVSDENNKTILINSTITSSEQKKCNTTSTNDTLTIEDTIVAGDLTVLSQKIEELNQNDLNCGKNGKIDEQILMNVIQKLADLPKGSVDCSALTPLLRDQFPDLLSTFLTNSKLSVDTTTPTSNKAQEALLPVPGSWIELPGIVGVKEKIFACADLEKTVFVPFANISQNWLLISIENLELASSQGQKLAGVKKNNAWTIMNFVDISMKDTFVPPNNQQSLKIYLTSRIATKFEIIIKFTIKEVLNREFQTRNLRILVNSVHPENYINVIPKDSINFGVIADQCFDQRTVQVTFDGICELPLTVYVEEGEAISQHFILNPQNAVSGNFDGECNDNIFHHLFHEGEKQVLEFRVIFQPNVLLQEDDKTQTFKALLVLMLGSKTESDGILRKIPIKGSVGFAKFLCNPSCNPLVFRASGKGQSVTRSYPLKNVGSLPIAFSVKVVDNESKIEEADDLFSAPNSFYLSKNEEAEIKITFNATTSENCTKRRLYLQIKPNGRALYDVELIGLIASSEREPLHRTSSASSSTKSVTNSDAEPVKFLTTCHSLSWPAVALEKEMRLTFQIKIKANASVSVRISFKKNSDSFKLVNEYGEKVTKLRKIFKPDVPQTLTVIFRPDLVGSHLDALILETSHSDRKKMISLNGIGGMPNLFLGNIKSDLNGCKLLTLQHSSNNEYTNTLIFKNEGKIPGFVLIRSNSEVFCLGNEMKIYPSSFVIAPNSTLAVKVSQKLKNDDLRQLLTDKDICKLATMSVVTGDEPSRLRLRKLIKSGKVKMSERLETLTATYHGEQTMTVKSFEDSSAFETQFLKSLNQVEVAIVLERSVGVCEPTILEEDSGDEFATIISVHDNTVIPSPKFLQSNNANLKRSTSGALNPYDSLSKPSSDEKVIKWFETLECN